MWIRAGTRDDLPWPNIVRVVDQPVIAGQKCLALELVQGRNLHQTVRRLREKQLRCPPQIALYILRHALYGLALPPRMHGHHILGQIQPH